MVICMYEQGFKLNDSLKFEVISELPSLVTLTCIGINLHTCDL